jgi:hypothetical protein
MDLAPLLCIIRTMKRHVLFLIWGLLLAVSMVSTVSTILAISSVSRVDFLIVMLLLHGPLAMRLRKSSPDFGSLNAYICDYEQINHCSGLLHGDLLHSLDVADSVVESIDDLDILNIRDGVSGIAEMFHVVLEVVSAWWSSESQQ